jgi:hypothetical protein
MNDYLNFMLGCIPLNKKTLVQIQPAEMLIQQVDILAYQSYTANTHSESSKWNKDADRP